ncbi:MAG: ATP-binding protein, partial [Micromonosporaceae bacterium]|nr:ATP-binding protein [Micromonosporaceae bacterium]
MIAAAGGHHLALLGPPGAGKTMLAQRLPGILPPLDDVSAQEATAIASIAGVLPRGSPLIRLPPFQAPHHTTSEAALVGGGAGLARPGALSLAHRGVLFLDEAPEFRHSVLNALRQPLEDGEVRLRRSGGETVYPARVQLVMAANPCPCASAAGDRHCQCSPLARRRYLGRLSGPLMDRIDLRVTLQPVRSAALLGSAAGGESSPEVARRVLAARSAAAARWGAASALAAASGQAERRAVRPEHTLVRTTSNATVPSPVLRDAQHRLPRATLHAAARAVDLGQLSARGYERVVRLAWTIADLDGRGHPDAGDVAEALDLRRGVLP